MAEIDSLQINISVSSGDAERKIERISEVLSALKQTVSGGIKGLSKFSDSLSEIVSVANMLSDTAPTQIEKLSNSLLSFQKLANIKISSSIANQINSISTFVESLDSNKVEKFNNSIISISNAIDHLVDQSNRVHSALGRIPDVVDKVAFSNGKLTTSVAKSSNQISLFGTSLESIGFRDALRSAHSVFEEVSNIVGNFIDTANQYVETQNFFRVSMRNFYDDALAYSELVNEKMGIDPSLWMNTQGTFMLMASGFGISSEKAYKLSKGLTELSFDISSLRNLKPEEVVNKLRSALAGEIEPIRELGISISQATLEEYALSKGIKESVSAMSEQEKALLRSIKVMEDASRIGYVGDFVKTLESPANSLRILDQQLNQLNRTIGNVFLPIVVQVIPWIQAFTMVVTDGIKSMASFLGIEMPEWDMSDWEETTFGFSETEDAITSATGAAKEFKRQLMGIDELTILQGPASVDDSLGGISGWAGELDIPVIWDEQMLGRINTEAEELKKKLEEILPLIGLIATAFATWKLTEKFTKGLESVSKFDKFLGTVVITAGATLLFDSIKEILFGDGLTWDSLLKGTAGGALVGGGIGAMLAKHLGLTWRGGVLTGGLIGFSASVVVVSISSILKEGITWQNLMLGTAGGIGLGVLLAKKLGLSFVSGGFFGGAIALSLSLLVNGIHDIIVGEDINLPSIVGGSALLGGAVGKSILSKLGLTVGASGLPFFFITAGITMAVSSVAWQLSNGVDVFGALATVLGTALSGAGIGFAVGGVPGAGVGFLVGMVAGIVIEAFAIDASGKAAYEATEGFKVMSEILERSQLTSDHAASSISNLSGSLDNIEHTMADFSLAQKLVDEIYAINDNANATNYELALMATKVETLNGLNIDGLSLSINETTGRVVETKKSVDELILSLQEEAKMSAIRDLLVQSYKDQYAAAVDANRALRDYDAASQSLLKTAEDLNATPWYDIQRRSELQKKQEKETEAVYAAQKAYSDAMDAVDKLDDAINLYSGELVDLKLAEGEIGTGVVKGLSAVELSMQGTAENMVGYGENIAETLRHSIDENTKESEYRNIWGKIGDWFADVFGIHSNSRLMKEYGGYITGGLLEGIKGNFGDIYSFFEDSLAEIWSAITSFFSPTKWKNVGENAINSLTKSLTSSLKTVEDIGSGIVEKIGDFSEINSSLNATNDIDRKNNGNLFEVNSKKIPIVPNHRNILLQNSFDFSGEAISNSNHATDNFRSSLQSSNDNIVNAVMSIGHMIVRSIEENSGTPVYVNGRQITSYQNQVNRMYGKPQQNV